MNHHKFIHDEEELRRFFDVVVPPLLPGEVYFLSLSARDKHLTTEEREEYSLGRSEMFERRIIRERGWFSFLRTVKKYLTVEGAYTGRTGKPIPTKCMVVYWNTNPTNALKAYVEFSKVMTTNIGQMLTGEGSSPEFFTRANRYLMNEFQRQRGTKHYIDYDLDRKEEYSFECRKEFEQLCVDLADNHLEFFVINTKGGWHVLIKTASIKFNYTKLFDDISDSPHFKEVKKNENEMIPLPGTMQADFPVSINWAASHFKMQEFTN